MYYCLTKLWYNVISFQDALVSSLVSPQISLRDLIGVPEDGVFDDNGDTDDTCSTCDSVYSVGEVSIVSDEDDAFTCDKRDEGGLFAVTEIVQDDKKRDSIETDGMVVHIM